MTEFKSTATILPSTSLTITFDCNAIYKPKIVKEMIERDETNIFDKYFKEEINFKAALTSTGYSFKLLIIDTVVEEFKNKIRAFVDGKNNKTIIKIFNEIFDNIYSLFEVVKLDEKEMSVWNEFENIEIRSSNTKFKQSNTKDIKIYFTCVAKKISHIITNDKFFFETDFNSSDFSKYIDSSVMCRSEKPTSDTLKNIILKQVVSNPPIAAEDDFINFFRKDDVFYKNFKIPEVVFSTPVVVVRDDFERSFFGGKHMFLSDYSLRKAMIYKIDFDDYDVVKFCIIFDFSFNLSKDLKSIEFSMKQVSKWMPINKNGHSFKSYMYETGNGDLFLSGLSTSDEKSGIITQMWSGKMNPIIQIGNKGFDENEIEKLEENSTKWKLVETGVSWKQIKERYFK